MSLTIDDLHNLAVIKHKENKLEEALSLYSKSIELNEHQPAWIYANAITIAAQIGDYEEGGKLKEKAEQIYNNSDEIYRAIGLAANKQGDFRNAINYYLKSLEINASQPNWLYSSLIENLVNINELPKAIEIGQSGLKIHNDFAWINYHLGEAYAVLENWSEALSYYTKAAQIEPNLPNIQGKINLAIMSIAENKDRESEPKEEIEDIAETINSYTRAIKLDAHQPLWLYCKVINHLILDNQLDIAIQIINQATQIYPQEADLFRSNYHKIFAENNHNVNSLLNLIIALEKNKELEQAITICQRSLNLHPNNQQLKTCLAKLTQQSNSTQNFDKINEISQLPGWKEYHEQANQAQSQGKLEEAIALYQQSIIRNPYYSWSYHNLADSLLKLGKLEDAVIFYHRALELYPDYFWSSYNLGVAYNKLGRWSDAIDLYYRSMRLNPSSHLPYQGLNNSLQQRWNAMFTQGDMLLKQGKREDASAIFRQTIQLFKNFSYTPKLENAKEVPVNPKVILIVDNHLDQCLHYRVEQKIEQLEKVGIAVEYFPWQDVKLAKNKLHFYHVVIFYRVPALPEIIETIEYAKAIKKVVFYEIDDLIFNEQEYPDPIESYGGMVSEDQYRGLVRGTTLFHEAMALCDYGIASTPALAKEVEKVVGKKTCFIHRNALDSLNSEFIKLKIPKLAKDYLSIFYGSGTKAHNADFEELAAPAIARILDRYPNVRLTLMGYLTLPVVLQPYQQQIDQVDLVKDVSIYWEFLRQADINIAVLLPTPVNNCKSELKWFEAACMGIPSVVSNTQTYREIISDGVDGLIAKTPEEWYAKLELLVLDAEFRLKIAKTAAQRVWKEYSIPVMAKNIQNIIIAGIEQDTRAGKLKPRTSKKKLLIVNVFYPPQSIGGATRIVKDNVDVLKANYGNEYEIYIFTTDDGNPHPYEILEYSYQGIHVTKVSSPMIVGMDWQYQNPKMYEIFRQYLEFNQPDLIHFHCVQRLTASVLEAAADLNIPYLVTVHDAWWISDHQFLVNERGIECNYQQNDPLVAALDSQDLTSCLKRQRYLKQRLKQASAILAVSEAFTKLYRRNGIVKTQANRNGIIPQPRLARKPSTTGKVRLAHIGGMAAHKGYFLFKDAVEKAQLSNCEVIIVSHAQVAGSVKYDSWGNTPVTFIAKIPQTEINKFYASIDVLIAPSMWPESFGLVTREAAAAGVWVVASNKGALAEDLIDGVNAHVFNPDQVENLISILQNIDRNATFYLQEVSKPTSIRTTEQQVKELINIYQSVFN
ncbi:putative glycosyltransferase [Chondrocystis sp. NIES-4102]|nr:putative glycosyltransferase [Chondrocystis sp. NIES-4102]